MISDPDAHNDERERVEYSILLHYTMNLHSKVARVVEAYIANYKKKFTVSRFLPRGERGELPYQVSLIPLAWCDFRIILYG